MSKLTVIRNSFANLCRGGASSLVILLLPPFLTRILEKDIYGTWLLILQLSTYISFLDFGIQTAVGRYVAHFNEIGETQKRNGIISTSFAILCLLGMTGFLGISLLALQLPNIFHDIPGAIQDDARWSLVLIGGSLAISLPFTVFGAIFIGLQRYDIPAWTIGSSKVLGGILVTLIAYFTHSMIWMAVGMAIANLLGGFSQYIAYRKLTSEIEINFQNISKKSGLEVVSYCSSLLVWSVGMLLVSGLDTAIIGFYDYKSILYYTFAAGLANLVMGLQGTTFASILPAAAVLGASGDRQGLGKLLVSATRYAIILLLITSLPLIIFSKYILTLWIGSDYAEKTEYLLQILIIANFVRQIGSPYSVIAMAIGEQRVILLSPILEGIISLMLSIFLTSRIGVNGVAISTVIAGFFGVAMHFYYNLPRTKGIMINTSYALILRILMPLILVSPVMIAWFSYSRILRDLVSQNIDITVSIAVMMTSFILLYMLVLTKDEKTTMARFMYKNSN
jgi:O-antigen/teichoic acid export membrane protein